MIPVLLIFSGCFFSKKLSCRRCQSPFAVVHRHCPSAVARDRCLLLLPVAHSHCPSLLPVSHCHLDIARWPLPVTVARQHCPSLPITVASRPLPLPVGCCLSAVACQPFPGSVGMQLAIARCPLPVGHCPSPLPVGRCPSPLPVTIARQRCPSLPITVALRLLPVSHFPEVWECY